MSGALFLLVAAGVALGAETYPVDQVVPHSRVQELGAANEASVLSDAVENLGLIAELPREVGGTRIDCPELRGQGFERLYRVGVGHGHRVPYQDLIHLFRDIADFIGGTHD